MDLTKEQELNKAELIKNLRAIENELSKHKFIEIEIRAKKVEIERKLNQYFTNDYLYYNYH